MHIELNVYFDDILLKFQYGFHIGYSAQTIVQTLSLVLKARLRCGYKKVVRAVLVRQI